jgi:hypothetical protein
MTRPCPAEFLTAYLSTVAKRWAETGVYDRLARTAGFQQLRRLHPAKKHAIQAGLSYLGALIGKNAPEQTIVEEVAKSVLEDAPPSRLINGGP